MKVFVRATYETVEWLEDAEDPIIRGGYTSPKNPWGGFKYELPDDAGAEDFMDWCTENVEVVALNWWDAAEYVLDFPGGVWDYSESESEQDVQTGLWTSVTLHVDPPKTQARVFALADVISDMRAADVDTDSRLNRGLAYVNAWFKARR